MLVVMKHRTMFYDYDGTDYVIKEWDNWQLPSLMPTITILSIDDIMITLSDEITTSTSDDITLTLAYSTMLNKIGWIYRDTTVYRNRRPWSEV